MDSRVPDNTCLHESLVQRALPLLLCVALVPAVFLLCNPFVEMGANDDWQYARMAKLWAETGKLHYDGWTVAMVGPHAAWGMAIVKLFGFSFQGLRASMIPIAIGCGAMMYLIARSIGVKRWSAAYASCGLLLSPLFVPLATVFMTDVSGLFLFLLTAYCAMRAAGSPRSTAVPWLLAATSAGLAAGAVRQILWGAPILMILAFALIRRKDRALAAISFAMLFVFGAAVILCLHWLYLQPYTRREVLHFPRTVYSLHLLTRHTVVAALTLMMFCVPVSSYLLSVQRVWRGALPAAAAAVSMTAIAAAFLPDLIRAPWLGNTVTRYGVLFANEVITGDQPMVLSDTASCLIGGVTWAVSVFAAITLFRLHRIWNSNEANPASPNRLTIFWWMTLPFCTAYLAIVLFRSLYDFATDRYLLPIVAVLSIGVTGISERLPGRRLAVFAWAVILLAGCYSGSITHDAFRLWEARAAATRKLSQNGIARVCIAGGYEYDGWTELEESAALLPPDKLPARNAPVEHFFLRSTPHVKPKYYVVVSVQEALASPPIVDVPYTTWLAPHLRHVLVQADPRASCPNVPEPQQEPRRGPAAAYLPNRRISSASVFKLLVIRSVSMLTRV